MTLYPLVEIRYRRLDERPPLRSLAKHREEMYP